MRTANFLHFRRTSVSLNRLLAIRRFSIQSFSFSRATNNKKLRETVALELSFLNSNLQLLKEELAQLNSNIEVYQAPTTGNDHNNALPMIPLGLKETKEVLLREPFMVSSLFHIWVVIIGYQTIYGMSKRNSFFFCKKKKKKYFVEKSFSFFAR